MTTNNKTSLLVPYQLPEFIRDNPDYANFELFVKAYYEWMEENGGVTEGSKNLLNYKDIDRTTNEFLDYYVNDFLPYFPKEILVDKEKALKVARQLYQSKGTLSSYKFLFRILYDSDVEVFFTKDAVLKASDGTWYVAKSLKLSSLNPNLLEIDNLRLFGETTKSIATVETSVIAGNKTEVFISNIERLFQSGEFVRVVDNSNQTVLFDGQPLRAKIVGQISQVRIDPQNRGLLYEVGDPVIVYDGLSSNTGIGAIAEVGTTTAGAIQRINVIDGGYGYTSNSILRITNAPGANATIASLNPAANSRANVVLVPVNEITLAQYTTIGNAQYSFFSSNPTANANTTLANSFTFTSFSTFPISSVFVNNGGGGIRQVPAVTALSVFPTDVSGNTASLTGLGMLGPIQIANGGKGYVANDTIVFSGGSGIGAYANVETVNATGAITSVVYVSNPQHPYPSGGIGYRNTNLPTLSVLSSNVQASNASLYVPGILGDGATFSVVVDRAGSVTTIRVTDFGEDYIATPNVSLKVQDILVSNVSITNLPIKGDYIYQGGSINTASYLARYDSITSVTTDEDPTLSKYNLRVFNYKSNPNTQLQLTIQDKNMNFVMANTSLNDRYNSSGYKNYGDGNAKGFAQFLNGLNISQGQYLNTQGHPSSFGVLQNENYNNFTYQITVEKEIEKYRDVLLNLLHPTGMKLLGRYALKSNNDFYFHGIEALNQGKTLADYTGYPGSSVTMTADFTNKSNNILKFNDLAGANIAGFILANSTIEVTPINGPNIISQIVSVNTVSNTVTLATNTWLTFGNVAFVSTRTNSNAINILSLTGAYDIVNNRQYSNTTYPLKDIVYAGDRILVGSNTSNSRTVSSVDYENGIIYLTSNANLTSTNTRLTVNRTLSAQTSVRIYGPLGQQYIPQLITESGDILTTEAGEIILLG
jgi:hypothetical protein